ncbi:DUF4386 domain-containing protein [Aquihabitans sp. McL0605]|uniref:DUF4386 domain-containing protein n=1 Tax=Aquihabitans sp. McL0605 TaxID=3415671 RepID=UPI003CECAE61
MTTTTTTTRTHGTATTTGTDHLTPPEGAGADRRAARIAGALYLVTFVASIPALPLYHDLLKDPRYLLTGGSDTGVLVGAFLEIICALAGIFTAVVLYRVVQRHDRTRALGFIASRTIEGAMIAVGVVCVLGVTTLHHDAQGASATGGTALLGAARGLVAVHDWTFLVGPGVLPAINALCLATVLYRTRLVPRIIPAIGLVGAPLLLISSTGTLFGGWDQVSGPAFLLALPIATWEFSLGVWLVVKGFRTPALPTTAPVVDADGDPEPEPVLVPVPA